MTAYPAGTAAAQDLLCCPVCAHVQSAGTAHCEVCGEAVSLRTPNSVQRALALLLTALVLYVPASILPIMGTMTLGRVTDNTILGGVVALIHHGSYPVAAVIFVASVMVPVLKMLAIAWLCWAMSRDTAISQHQANKIYHLTELVGKWSMVDVFVVALLVALIQLDGIMMITPGPAALAFAGVVVFTMLSAQALDTRLIWDKQVTSQHDVKAGNTQ